MYYFRFDMFNGDASKFMYSDINSKQYFARPWMAYVTIKKDNNTYQCGGAIINQRYV